MWPWLVSLRKKTGRKPLSRQNSPDFIPVNKPWLGESESEAVKRVISSQWVTQGPEVAAFEKEFASYVGAPHACAVANCTVALQLALKAVGVGPGDEVITVSHSFIATANSVRYLHAVPVFVDIKNDATYNIDPDLLAKAISPKTKAILCVHQVGMPCDLTAIMEIAQKHSIPVVEDAACAIGSEIQWNGKWEKIGRPVGDIACFSFHPRKMVTTGDGGMITTAKSEYDKKFRLWRQHSMDVPDLARHNANEVIFESYTELGYNFRLTDIQAAIGREQLKKIGSILEKRKEQADFYLKKLAEIPDITLPHQPNWAKSNWQSFCVGLPDGIDQKKCMEKALKAGIAFRRGIMCSHREPAYSLEPWTCSGGTVRCNCGGRSCKKLKNSERAQDHSVILPLFHQMTPEQQERVIQVMKDACSR